MEVRQVFKQFCRNLQPLFGEREAQTMARIVFEDAFLIRHPNRSDPFPTDSLSRLENILHRLEQAEPLQYILNQAHFYGLDLYVDQHVLIPRPETEELVHWILQDLGPVPGRAVLDIGAGSGCIALALKKNRPGWMVATLDASAEALAVTRKNAGKLHLAVETIHMDFLDESRWASLPAYDVVVSNPPYIPRKEAFLMPRQVLDFEPEAALFVPDEQVLLFYEKIARFGQGNLTPDGRVYLETNEYHAAEVTHLFQKAGYREVALEKDMQGKERMVRAMAMNII